MCARVMHILLDRCIHCTVTAIQFSTIMTESQINTLTDTLNQMYNVDVDLSVYVYKPVTKLI